jgi:hypothetical protein
MDYSNKPRGLLTKKVGKLQTLAESLNQNLLNATNNKFGLKYYIHQQMKASEGAASFKRVLDENAAFGRMPRQNRMKLIKRQLLHKYGVGCGYQSTHIGHRFVFRELTPNERTFFAHHINELKISKRTGISAIFTDPDRQELVRLQEIVMTALPNDTKKAKRTRTKANEMFRHFLTRKILYIGSECNRKPTIKIKDEVEIIKSVLTSSSILFYPVKRPNIEEIVSEWFGIRPSILFFSCHGDNLGLFLQNKQGKCTHIPNSKLIPFFKKRTNYTECVILSSCESNNLGKSISLFGKKVICINQKVDINTASDFNRYFFKFLNDHSSDDSSIFREAYNYSIECITLQQLKDYSAFEFIESGLID